MVLPVMKRRDFLKTCLAGVAVPSIAFPKANPVEDALALLEKYGCNPLTDGNYVGFCHPDVYDDIMAMGCRVGKTQANVRWMTETINNGYIGEVSGMSFHPSRLPPAIERQANNQNYLNLRGRW